ncbi:MAG: DUF3641 domain-containing protein, partial [Dolichospermum sp.]
MKLCSPHRYISNSENFSLTPEQQKLEIAYKNFLLEKFDIRFNNLFTITNIPVGST